MFESKYNLISLAQKISNPKDTVTFLQNKKILKNSHECEKCSVITDSVKCRPGTKYFYFECRVHQRVHHRHLSGKGLFCIKRK